MLTHVAHTRKVLAMPKTLGVIHQERERIANDLGSVSKDLETLAAQAERAIEPLLPARGFPSTSELLDELYGDGNSREAKADALITRAATALKRIRRRFEIILETSFDEGTQTVVTKALKPSVLIAGSVGTDYSQFKASLERLHQTVEDLSNRLPFYREDGQAPERAPNRAPDAAALAPRVRVLFLAANPEDTERLGLDEEVRSIGEKLRSSKGRETIILEQAWAVRPDDVLQELSERRPHIVHFSGHGTDRGEIVLTGSQGDSRPMSQRALKALFSAMKDNVRLVVLNACFSEAQASAISEVIDVTVGMLGTVDDVAARVFAAAFYRALGFGKSVKQAFDESHAALLMEGFEDEQPQLKSRAGIDPAAVVFC